MQFATKFTAVLIGMSFLLLVSSCDREDLFITDSSAALSFSLDTLRFDTVFTELGSATRYFKVYNTHNRSIRISSIQMEAGVNTSFRLNIDGIPGNEASEIAILPGDSLYIFCEVTVDPDAPLSVSPFVIEERVLFETNGNNQQVHLEAWGQNANYFPSRFNKGVPVVLSCDNGEITWDDPKPYVIYGEIFIDDCTLNIPPGTQIYVHGGIAQNEEFGVFNDGFLYTLENGRLICNGTPEEPITIQGDRLEEGFQEQSGQWNGIILGRGSKGNSLSFTTVKNSRFGILVDSTADLVIRNSQIYNTSSSGLIGFAGKVTAENCLFYNNGANAVQLVQGGDYQFTYCTLASYGIDASALGMNNFFCYDDPINCQVLETFPLKVRFKNSILFGTRRDEIELLDIAQRADEDLFDVKFEDCIVKVEELLEQQEALYADFLTTICDPCINASREDVLFLDANEDDYHLDTLSIAEGIAKPILTPQAITIDLEGNPRDETNPDLGCFEFQ